MKPRFVFCSQCAGKLAWKRGRDGESNKTCVNCGYVVYNNPVTAAAALILRGDQILLVKRAIEPDSNTWSIPGGFIRGSESITAGLIREVREEIGARFRPQRLFSAYNRSYRWHGYRVPVVIISYCGTISGTIRLGPEHRDYGWFPLNRLPRPIAVHHVRRDILTLRRAKRRTRC